MMATERWRALQAAGARAQRLVWASTSTKNPRYSDVLYVDELIGPETVNTIPPSTIEAFRAHGKVGPTLEAGVEEAEATLAVVERAGISMHEVAEQLLVDGLDKFVQPYDAMLRSVAAARNLAFQA
jgi:transaldolase